jgi:hypothetical protein
MAYLLALLLQASPVYYEVRYFHVGAAEPFGSYWLVPPAITPGPGVGQYRCGLVRSPSTVTLNPTAIEWDDPEQIGQVCRYDEVVGGPLFWLPLGAYEASLRAWNDAGASPESSPRAAFGIGSAAFVAPSGVTVVRR